VGDDVWYISGYTNVPDDPSGGGKAAALDALQKLAPDKVSEALIKATRSKTVEVRVWALGELVGRKDDTGADAVVKALVRALGDAGGGDAERTARMVLAGRHIRRVAAEGLQKLGAKSAVPALVERVGDDVWYISGYTNVPDDPSGGGKAAALDALQKLAPDKVSEALVPALKSKVPTLRHWSASQLESFGDETAVPALMERVGDDVWYISGYTNVPDDPSGGGKAAALDALKKLAPDKVSEALAVAMRSKTAKVRAWAEDQVIQLVNPKENK
jgi:HEAT repeat protein